ncbi:peptide deformylase [Deinococcus planocerae]|uniref:peptide deformylase n=1 Tax=Deinococcus planocerae TaxID=1737569 RepID=UPI000C7F5BE6|nr:peptide deformylase [Deinococcus planocerae]
MTGAGLYPIRLYGDPVLRGQARVVEDLSAPVQVPGFAPQPLREVARTMLETMYEARGAGLAGPQVGLPVQLFVAVEYDDDTEEGKPLRARALREFVVLNPVVEPLSDRVDTAFGEGCLSIPGLKRTDVPRHSEIRVTYTDLGGERHSMETGAFLARIFQHETDHLHGLYYLDRLPGAVTEEYVEYLAELKGRARAYLQTLEAQG